MNQQPTTDRGGFPLGILFVTIAAVAIVFGMLAELPRQVTTGEVGVESLVISGILGGLVLGFLGILIGLFQYNRLRGIGLGGVLGFLTGVFLGPLYFYPREYYGRLMWLSLGGSLLLLVLASAVRLASSRSRVNVPATGGGSSPGQADQGT